MKTKTGRWVGVAMGPLGGGMSLDWAISCWIKGVQAEGVEPSIDGRTNPISDDGRHRRPVLLDGRSLRRRSMGLHAGFLYQPT